jgi:hypothetical protein
MSWLLLLLLLTSAKHAGGHGIYNSIALDDAQKSALRQDQSSSKMLQASPKPCPSYPTVSCRPVLHVVLSTF